MSDGPRIMPHPDDPQPGDGESSGSSPSPSGTQESSFGQPAATTPASAPQFSHTASRPYPGAPISMPPSTEQNMLGMTSLGISGVAVLMMVAGSVTGGVPLLLPLIGGIVGTVFGVRGLNAVRRDRASNRGIALAGTIIGTVTIIAVPLYFLIVVAAIVAFVDSVG